VKANRGAAGVDGESLAMFEKDLKGNLYKCGPTVSFV
jgi:RNA-directed DNA polymerase